MMLIMTGEHKKEEEIEEGTINFDSLHTTANEPHSTKLNPDISAYDASQTMLSHLH